MRTLDYNDRSGIIAPGLFGFGIGFPEAKVDRFGTLEHLACVTRLVAVWLLTTVTYDRAQYITYVGYPIY